MLEENLISIGEAAKIIDVSIDTLRRWDKSGKLNSFKSPGGHRVYSRTQIEFHINDLVKLARAWALEGAEIKRQYYCSDSSIFNARLSSMQNLLISDKKLDKISSLLGAITGEIGINSFDHNLGKWTDTPGIFFGHDTAKKVIVLADRGQGILTTLRQVRHELNNDQDALKVAFSEIVSGRAPENRGNGLKFVRQVVGDNPMGLIFQSGDAVVTLTKDGDGLKIDHSPEKLNGCLALITF